MTGKPAPITVPAYFRIWTSSSVRPSSLGGLSPIEAKIRPIIFVSRPLSREACLSVYRGPVLFSSVSMGPLISCPLSLARLISSSVWPLSRRRATTRR